MDGDIYIAGDKRLFFLVWFEYASVEKIESVDRALVFLRGDGHIVDIAEFAAVLSFFAATDHQSHALSVAEYEYMISGCRGADEYRVEPTILIRGAVAGIILRKPHFSQPLEELFALHFKKLAGHLGV